MKNNRKLKNLFSAALVITFSTFTLAFADEPAPAPEAPAAPQKPAAEMMPPPRHPGSHEMKGRHSNRPEDIRMIMQRLKVDEPETYKRLVQLRKEDMKQFAQEIRKYQDQQPKFLEKIIENEKKCWDLAKRIKNAANEEEKAALTLELKALIENEHELAVKNFQERLAQLQKGLEHLQQNGDKIKEKRLETFLTTEPPMIARPVKGPGKGPRGPKGMRPRRDGKTDELPPPPPPAPAEEK